MAVVEAGKLVERIWAHDPAVWTGSDEAQWLGWLDEPLRARDRVDGLLEFATTADFDHVVLLGMGGSSLAPEVMRRSFGVEHFHVLDTTHPKAILALEERLDLDRTLFLSASKSGSTLETRSHTDYFWERTGGDGGRFVAITDPGSQLERAASERAFLDVFPGEPAIGGRYSALSVFGLVPAALMGLDVRRLVERAVEMREACRLDEGNPGLELGLALAEGWRDGRDKVVVTPNPGGFGLWVEQLLAESTGKEGKGLVPIIEPYEGPDAQQQAVRIETDPYELGQEFFRWEFATAVAGSLMGINPFDQPNVQEAKDRTGAILEQGVRRPLQPDGSVDDLLADAGEGDYVFVQAFIDPADEERLRPLLDAARGTGRAVAWGLGPRYLHSTGQLHKGGPNTGVFVQVVDDAGEDVAIPGQPFGFGDLIAAQAAGDYEALKERGRRVARVRLEDL